MQKLTKRMILMSLPLALAACAGGGIKDQAEIQRAVQAASPNAIFVYRDTGFQGSAILMPISLNGAEVARLGVNESIEIQAPIGTNTLTVAAGGIDGSLMKPAVAQVVKNGSSAHYFVVGFKQKFFGAEITLVETTPTSYLAAAQ